MGEALRNRRDVSIDFLKLIATFLVLNSHMDICYGPYSVFATGGGVGDSLFFFISGFCLFNGRKSDFMNWYKRRLARIYPTVIAMGLVSCIFFSQEFDFIEIMSMSNYWFLQCILVCYIVLYPIIFCGWNLMLCVSFLIAIMVCAFPFFKFDGQLFYGVDNYFRWIFYLSVMLIGGAIFMVSNKIHYKWWSLLLCPVCIVCWYVIIKFCAGGVLQLLSLIPIVGFCICLYSIGKSPFVERLFRRRIIGNVFFISGNLCLESYLVQGYLITDTLNGFFPLNIPVIMIVVLFSAYILHIISRIISQIFDSRTFSWRGLFLYKDMQ